MQEEISFRPLQKADVPRIAELERLCFRSPWSEKALLGEVRNKVAHYRVGIVDGCIAAYAGMWLLFDEAHITNVAVAPDCRRRGFARLLMREMFRTALLHGAGHMTLEVRETNLGAQALYAGLGFLQSGRRKGYYSDTGEDALILWNHDIAACLQQCEANINTNQV
ncbi:MAG: ribosomal protein S18-alanine N-acetyltransferase [Christensenellaceae bacterium]|jgi:ribosomal-protein-alanine N-acetyltransferase|nr:ribosomal protein S18-alanine N-acetyltransferase [Christensenellaceae bacterium]